MRKLVVYSLFVLLLISCNLKKDTIQIGAILPLTGDASQWGIPPQRGAQIAIDQINQNGGVKGKMLELIVEDSQCQPRIGISSINKLISVNHPIAIIGGVCSSVTLAIAPVAEKEEVVLISPASTNPKITDAGDYIFRVIPSDELRGKVFAKYITDLGYKRGAILYINNDGGKGNKETFEKYFTNNSGVILVIESYMPNTQNVITQLTKIRETNPEFLMVVSYPEDAITVLRDIQDIKLDLPLFFQTEALDDPIVRNNAGKSAENVTYITYAESGSEKSESFKEIYQNKFNVEPELFAAEAYDAVYLIFESIKNGHNIKDYLYGIQNYEGVSGQLSMNNKGDVIKPLAIKQIFSGSPTTIVKQ